MAQKIPIIITATPAPTGIKSLTFDQLNANLVKYQEAYISDDVSFFLQGPSDPASDSGIFYNTAANRFKSWDANLGRYIPISELQVGDLKPSAVAGDDVASGWIQLDGRDIDLVTGISQAQKTILETLYGANGTLPDYTFLSGLNSLPPDTTFSSISNPSVEPANNVISNLPVSNAYDNLEVKALRDNTESVRDSADKTQQALTASLAASEKVLNALNQSGTSGPKWKVFVGYQ